MPGRISVHRIADMRLIHLQLHIPIQTCILSKLIYNYLYLQLQINLPHITLSNQHSKQFGVNPIFNMQFLTADRPPKIDKYAQSVTVKVSVFLVTL